jgi:hypothetical protein
MSREGFNIPRYRGVGAKENSKNENCVVVGGPAAFADAIGARSRPKVHADFCPSRRIAIGPSRRYAVGRASSDGNESC